MSKRNPKQNSAGNKVLVCHTWFGFCATRSTKELKGERTAEGCIPEVGGQKKKKVLVGVWVMHLQVSYSVICLVLLTIKMCSLRGKFYHLLGNFTIYWLGPMDFCKTFWLQDWC